MQDIEYEEAEQLMREDFAYFMFVVWSCLNIQPHPIQTKTARWIAKAGDRRALFAMRNFGKTLLIATLICWYFKQNPNTTILVQSATKEHAVKIVSFVKKLIETSPYLAEMRPNIDTIWGRTRLELANGTVPDKDPNLAAYGVGSQITGSHVDHIIADDIETPENSRTVEARDKIKEKIGEYEDVVNPGGTITVIGTFQTIEAVLVDVVRQMGYTGIRIPAQYPEPADDEEDGSVNSMWLLAPWLVDDLESGKAQPGDATYPERWPLDRLMEVKAKSPSRYMLQRMLDPTLSDESKYPLKLRDIIVHTVDPEKGPTRVMWANEKIMGGMESPGIGSDRYYEYGHVAQEWKPYTQKIMWVDPAGRGQDEVGYAVGYMLNGMIRVPAWGGLDGGYDPATLKKIAKIAQQCEVDTILVEPDWGDGMYTTQLRSMVQQTLGLSIGVTDAPRAARRGAKEPWICDVLEPVLTAHRLMIDPQCLRDIESPYQLSHITRSRGCLRKDDRVEALAGVCSMFTDLLFKDIDKAEEEQKEKIRQKEINQWHQEVHGSRFRQRRPSWGRV
jgi:hypothetical protein